MSDDKVEVKVTANTTGLKPGLENAANNTEQAAQKMQQAVTEAQGKMQSALSSMIAKLRDFGVAAKENMGAASESIKGGTEGLSGGAEKAAAGFEKLNVAFAMIAAALGGGKVFKEAVSETTKFTAEANKLQKVLLLDSAAASALNIALGDVYSSADEFTDVATKLERQVKSNEKGLNDLGLKTRDASGHLRDMNSMTMDAIGIVNSYKAGTDQAVVSMELFGARTSNLGGLLRLNNKVLEEAREKQSALNLVVTADGKKALAEYKAAMNDVGDVMLGIKKTIGDAVIPVLTALAKQFAEYGPTAVEFFGNAVRGLMTVFEAVRGTLQTVGVGLGNTLMLMMNLGQGFADFWSRIFKGDFSGALDVAKHNLKIFGEDQKRVWKESLATAQESAAKIKSIWAQDKSGAAPAPGPDGKTAGDLSKTKHSRVPEWETELEELKTHLAEEANAKGQYFKMSEQQELEYWQKIKAQHAMSHEEDIAVRKKTATLQQDILKDGFEAAIAKMREEESAARNNAEAKIAIAKQESERIKQYYGEGSKEYQKALQHEEQLEKEAAKQKLEIAKANAEQIRDIKLGQVQADEDYAKLQYDLGNITNATLLQQQEQFEQRSNEIKRQALLDRAALIDPDTDPVAKAQIDAQIEALELQHQQKLRQIRNQQTVNNKSSDKLADLGTDLGNASGVKNGGSLGKDMFSSFSSAMDNISSRTKTFKQNMLDTYKAIYQSFAQNLIVLPLKEYMAGIARMLATKLGFLTQTKIADTTSGATAIITEKAKAASIIPAEASIAAGGAASAMASIPYVGPALAAAAYAETFALVMSGLATASAAGGYDIPAGVNPLVQTHAKEMILPAKYADVIRGMAEGDSSGASGSSIGDIHIHALDAKSVTKLLMSNDRTIAKALKQAIKDGAK